MQNLWTVFTIAAVMLLGGCLRAQLSEESMIKMHPVAQEEKAALMSATAVLKPLSQLPGTGFGVVDVFTDGTAVVHIRTNLVPRERGAYVAWLEGSLLSEPIKVGELRNPKGDATYLLQEEVHRVLPPMAMTLSITWEPSAASREKSTRILAGTFVLATSR